MKPKSSLTLVGWVVLCEAAGGLGSLFTMPSVRSWYPSIVKPALNPPAWVFGPVWTTLFALMGIAAFLIWRQGTEKRAVRNALFVFGIQLALNVFWSLLFFGLHSPLASLVEIILLWVAILWTTIAFHRLSKPAAYLLVPYLLWVSFASYLNAAIWWLNR